MLHPADGDARLLASLYEAVGKEDCWRRIGIIVASESLHALRLRQGVPGRAHRRLPPRRYRDPIPCQE